MINKFVGYGLMLLSLVGCAGGSGPSIPLAECKGSVTYEGKPVSGAAVTFVVEGAPLAVATTDSTGKFVMTTNGRKGAPIGSAKVGISKTAAPPEGAVATTEMKPEDMRKMQMENMSKKQTAEKPPIPARYGNPKSSTLTAEVTKNPADNDFSFILTD